MNDGSHLVSLKPRCNGTAYHSIQKHDRSRRISKTYGTYRVTDLEVHVAHAGVAVGMATAATGWLLLGLLDYQRLGRQHQARDRSRVLNSGPSDLSRVDDARSEHVLDLAA